MYGQDFDRWSYGYRSRHICKWWWNHESWWGLQDVDCIERETKASAFNIGGIFRIKKWKEEELPRIHKSRERAVIYMETKGGKDWGSSGQSYQRCQKRQRERDQ